MSKFPSVRLGDVADVNWGDTSVTKASYVNDGFPAYSATGCDGFLPYADFDHPAIVLSAIGARCGKTWFASGKWSCIKNTIRYWSTSEQLDNRYLFWATADEDFWPKRGAAQPFITIGDSRELRIPLPPPPEQRRIAAILDKADALRTKRRETLAQLDRLARAVFEDAASQAKTTGTASTKPLASEYWFQEGPGVRKWQFTSAGVKLLNVGNIEKSGHLNLSKTERHVSLEEAHGKYGHFLCDAGNLVIASSGISIEQDGLLATRGAFVEESHLPLCMNTSTIRFKSLGTSSLEYLRAWLSSFEFRSQMTKLVTGSAQLNFGPSHLRELVISVPSPEVQSQVTKVLRAVNEQRLKLEVALETSSEFFLSLEHLAFRGEL